jgi:DNA-binding MarR family transcriptional regulator
MKYQFFKLKTRNSVLLVLFIVVFLFNFTTIVTSEESNDETQLTKYTYSVSKISDKFQEKEFSKLYPAILSNKNFNINTIVLDGNKTKVVELPSDSTAIKLPDNLLAIKYLDENVSVLPIGSTITYYNEKPVIRITNESTVLQVSELISFPIDNFITNASFSQSIERLDNYEVSLLFNELDNDMIKDNIENYSVLWGDGESETFNKETKTVSHAYNKSGIYSISVKVNDEFGLTHQLQQTYTVDYEGHVLHTYFLIQENKEPIAITSSTGLSAFFIGFIALSETGKYKFLALLTLLIPLYTRIQKEDVLDQFVRGQIFGFIKTNPGVHYNQIRREMGVKNGTLSYHLSVLEKTELIKSRREGLKYRAFYPTGMRFPKNERFRLTELQIKILDVIKNRDGINQKDIAKEIGRKPQTINYNIKVLKQAELINVIKRGRRTICYINVEQTNSDKTAE